jgi:hypothetical protein
VQVSRKVHIEAYSAKTYAVPNGTLKVCIELTPKQCKLAVIELLGGFMSEQEAYEFLRAEFPEWFEEAKA